MGKYKMPIGGEFWYQKELVDLSINNNFINDYTLLSDGNSSIQFIISDIDLSEDEYLLLPSYLCPTIIDLISKLNVKYKFYNISLDLSLDTSHITQLINTIKVKAVLFIDYFGFTHNESIRIYLRKLKEKGIILIEDAVQAFWVEKETTFIGDYIFNSYRKFLPIDGSMLICSKKAKYNSKDDEYSKLIEEARIKKTDLILNNKGNEEEVLQLFSNAHKEFYKITNIYGINKADNRFLLNIPVESLKKLRMENFNYLITKLRDSRNLTLIYNSITPKDLAPLCLPIIIENRDKVKAKLAIYGIYCPIHWDLRHLTILRDFPSSLYISKRILSLPIDWRYSFTEMDYISEVLLSILTQN